MYPITLSYSYAETTTRVLHGRTQVTFTDPADLNIDMTFSEFVQRSTSGPEPSEVLKYIFEHYDEEQMREELLKLPGGNRYLAALTRLVHEVAA
ncbi:hypothetical protein ID858_07965 [Xenorhabdus sp. DI]|uniref:hypothetical protein n=1 Tax=Xenorhabdus doucetiae TaxID=351671 RepID=UPI0019C447AD|nr:MULTISPECIES: hypothetical protein [unclassified Xenorhabdus]MBD2785419.1 hypothetical protein [Xenorhabdus sp. 3]MBD2788443.1 hypothetical protein [Xenorhabdus sp. DI]